MYGISSVVAQGSTSITLGCPQHCSFDYLSVIEGASVNLACTITNVTGSVFLNDGAALTIAGTSFDRSTSEINVGFESSILNRFLS